jgi:hypothetical protein
VSAAVIAGIAFLGSIWTIRLRSIAAIGMSAQQFMRTTPSAAPCSPAFAPVRTLSTRSKQQSSVAFLESACSACNAISGAFARLLADETGLKANFIQGTVDDVPHLTPGPFDLVFASICGMAGSSPAMTIP